EVDLRGERARLVPEDGIVEHDCAGGGTETPGMRSEPAQRYVAAGKSGGVELLDARGEIAHLVQRVPDGHVHFERVLDAGDFHADLKMAGGARGERDGITDGGARGQRGEPGHQQEADETSGTHVLQCPLTA